MEECLWVGRLVEGFDVKNSFRVEARALVNLQIEKCDAIRVLVYRKFDGAVEKDEECV